MIINTKVQENKLLLVERAKRHREADNIIQGTYWKDGKGCCVGCLAETSDEPHKRLSEFTGAPVWLFMVADTIHEGLNEEDSKSWPVLFSEALATTPDNEQFWKETINYFKIAIADECLRNKEQWFKNDTYETYADKVVKVLELVKKLAGQELSGKKVDWSAARSAADSASRSAAESARSAALSASWYAAESARSAALSASRYAAESARSAADSASWSAAESAWSAALSARSAAWSAGYKRIPEELLKIMTREIRK